jgi:hypothetical protein
MSQITKKTNTNGLIWFLSICFILLISYSIYDKPTKQINPIKEEAKEVFAKATAEAWIAKLYSEDSSEVYRSRFIKVLKDSNDVYTLNYAKSFSYLIWKKKIPRESLIKENINNSLIYSVKGHK